MSIKIHLSIGHIYIISDKDKQRYHFRKWQSTGVLLGLISVELNIFWSRKFYEEQPLFYFWSDMLCEELVFLMVEKHLELEKEFIL